MSTLNFVIFGITSDLSKKKLIPALNSLLTSGHLGNKVSIVGLVNRQRSISEMEQLFAAPLLFSKSKFIFGDFASSSVYQELKAVLPAGDTIFYLATLPSLYPSIFTHLKNHHLHLSHKHFTRIMVEKPLGTNESTSKKANQLLRKYFSENQIYRIDHYLAKETVQNILFFRFQNPAIKSLFGRHQIDHLQITLAESFGVEDRGSYYDTTGALCDIGQNHILQMIALAIMEEPLDLIPKKIVAQRKKLIKSLVPMPSSLVLGQYDGYNQLGSSTDTYFSFCTYSETGPLKNIPIYVRGGKKLPTTVTEITIVYKNNFRNFLTYRIQPNEGVILNIAVKKPGFNQQSDNAVMQFCYHHLQSKLLSAYEKLIIDAIRGNQTFFNTSAEIESQWRFIDKLIANRQSPKIYPAGTWGPTKTLEQIIKDGRKWLEPSSKVCQC